MNPTKEAAAIKAQRDAVLKALYTLLDDLRDRPLVIVARKLDGTHLMTLTLSPSSGPPSSP